MSIFEFENLYRAYLDCRKNKRKTVNAVKFEYNLEENLMKLSEELKTRKYEPGRSICFAVSKPTPREIFAADFRDRVVHHLLVGEIIASGERNFIFDSYACRKGKGIHQAVKKLIRFMKKITKNYRHKGYYAQLDIAGFFMSIDKNILYKILEKMISKQKNKSPEWKEEVLWVAKKIIFHQPAENYITKGNLKKLANVPRRKSLFFVRSQAGLPIGNYTSQFFGNLYLNELDHFIKRELKVKHYLRYVDDFILFGENQNELKENFREIGKFLEKELKLCYSFNKCRIKNVNEGIDFLGYFVKPKSVFIRKRVVKSFKSKIKEVSRELKDSLNPEEKIAQLNKGLRSINSYYGHFKMGYSYNLRRKVLSGLLKTRQEFVSVRDFEILRMKSLSAKG